MGNSIVTYQNNSALSNQIKDFFMTDYNQDKAIEPYENSIPVLQDGHSTKITSIQSITMNGSVYIISGSINGTVIEFDSAKGYIVFNISISHPAIYMTYSKNNITLAVAGNNYITFIDALQGKILKSFSPDNNTINGIIFDDNLHILFVTTLSKYLYLFDTKGKLLKKIYTGKFFNTCMAYNEKSNQVVVGTQKGQIIKIDIKNDLTFSKKTIHTYKNKNPIMGIIVLPKKMEIIVYRKSGAVFIEDISFKKNIKTFVVEYGIVNLIFINNIFWFLHSDGKIHLWSREDDTVKYFNAVDTLPVSCISIGNDNFINIGLIGKNPKPALLNFNTLKVVKSFKGYTAGIKRVFPDSNGNYFYTYGDDSLLRKWSINNFMPLKDFSGHISPVNAINISKNLISVSGSDASEGKIIIHDYETKKIINIHAIEGVAYINCVSSSFNNSIFISTDNGDLISLSQTGNVINEWHISDNKVFIFTNNKSIFTVSENTISEWYINEENKLTNIFSKKIDIEGKFSFAVKFSNQKVIMCSEHIIIIYDYINRIAERKIKITQSINNCSFYNTNIIIVTQKAILFLSLEGKDLSRIESENNQFNDCIILKDKIIVVSTNNGLQLYTLSLKHFLSIRFTDQNEYAIFTPDKSNFYVTDKSLIEFYTERQHLFEGKGYDLITDPSERRRKEIRFIDELEILNIIQSHIDKETL